MLIDIKKMSAEPDRIVISNIDLACNVTRELFTDPVVTECGHVYERKGFLYWRSRNNHCLVCKKQIQNIAYPVDMLKQLLHKEKTKSVQFCFTCRSAIPKEVGEKGECTRCNKIQYCSLDCKIAGRVDHAYYCISSDSGTVVIEKKDFCCPISKKPFTIPAVAECGHMFERDAFLSYRASNNHCPLCEKTISATAFPVEIFECVANGERPHSRRHCFNCSKAISKDVGEEGMCERCMAVLYCSLDCKFAHSDRHGLYCLIDSRLYAIDVSTPFI